ncbi:MAG: hypothetical protein ACOY0T_37450 [Myxococcota bacterium]
MSASSGVWYSFVMIHAGALPLGSYAEALASPPVGPVPILADYVDPETGDIIDLLRTRTPVDGALIEGLRVERNSGPAVALVGHTMREIRHLDDTSVAESASRAREGYRELERLGLLRTSKVEVNTDNDAMEISVEIVDLTVAAGQPNKRTYAAARKGGSGQ